MPTIGEQRGDKSPSGCEAAASSSGGSESAAACAGTDSALDIGTGDGNGVSELPVYGVNAPARTSLVTPAPAVAGAAAASCPGAQQVARATADRDPPRRSRTFVPAFWLSILSGTGTDLGNW
ncbi:Protein of unknown function [Gryllus bimaculatus]|nr:Protein of unknown function [Gryllus bimaculatus]